MVGLHKEADQTNSRGMDTYISGLNNKGQRIPINQTARIQIIKDKAQGLEASGINITTGYTSWTCAILPAIVDAGPPSWYSNCDTNS